MTKVAPSTLRKYVAEFSRHFSDSARKPRGRRFADIDIDLIKRIKQLYSEGLTHPQVDERLSAIQLVTVSPDDTLSLVPAIAQEFETLRSQLARMEVDQQDIRARLERLEAFYKLPWYKRLGRRPPE